MQSRMKLGTIEPTTFRTIFQSLTNWLTGIFLILLGLYHNLAGGSLIGQWLQSLNPPISPNDVNMGQLGFEMGGYLAMAIGLTFIMFSPLEVGKKWFYSELEKLANLETRTGNDTYEMRQSLGLKKSKNKLSSKFDAHCVDSWVLVNWFVGGHIKPENTQLIEVIPLELHRRQLHRLQHSAGHIRSRYGGTISAGFKRGSVVKHPKFGFCYVGGWQESPTKKDPNRKTISLHSLGTGKRLTQNATPKDCIFKSYGSWRISTATKVA